MAKNTSWETSGKWYHSCVGEKGHYYHQSIILKQVVKLLQLTTGDSILDIGCGQGVLKRNLPKDVSYTGIDASQTLIHTAKQSQGEFILGDACKKLPLAKKDFDAACFILSLQNMEKPEIALKNASSHLKIGGKLILVLNHPCFRIPRQSDWGIDTKKKLQYRRMNVYMTSQEIPIHTNPGLKEKSSSTISFHHPLSSFVKWLVKSGFGIIGMEEWCSDKTSEGGRAKMENRARKEFPLFMCLLCEKTKS